MSLNLNDTELREPAAGLAIGQEGSQPVQSPKLPTRMYDASDVAELKYAREEINELRNQSDKLVREKHSLEAKVRSL